MPRTWNYRVLAFPDGTATFFQIHEVHYEDGVPCAYGEPHACVGGENMVELYETLDRMREAVAKPALWGGDRFPEIYKPD